MLVIKKINNNVALCVDDDGRELIAFSKGIGFRDTPYEFTDLKRIKRTFYNITDEQMKLIGNVSDDAVLAGSYILEYAQKKLGVSLKQYFTFTLADHIDFVVNRCREGQRISYLNKYDIRHIYPNEYEIGVKAVEYIVQTFKINIPKEEAIGIAMHIINGENISEVDNNDAAIDDLIDDIVKLIEREKHIEINRDSFDFARFVTHLQYLVKRIRDDNPTGDSDNIELYKVLKGQYKEVNDLVLRIKNLIERYCGKTFGDEESVYLILHTNRLCTRIDNNRPLR